ncbi:MAG: 23S rRNA (guanosine(2251)-2'-O)-methyltransferase RlmB [Desulfobacterales bacterium]|nr:MAG: 23S rRNA (guanosine(2251)-2'-O)-methyltransferase RlmB [Desulfobacterales bacterium]
MDPISAVNADPFLLLLDGILDPHNLGAIIRTALCAGVHGVIIPRDRAASPTPAVSKASAGALEHVRLIQVTNLVRTVQALKEKGLWIYGLDRSGEHSIFASDLTGPLALVIGGEQRGIRPLVKKNCDLVVAIPQVGPMNSLNASVAAAVAMFETFRQRTRAEGG